MKKLLPLFLALALTLLASSCGAKLEGRYTVINDTGERLTALYLYETGGSDKGPNLAETCQTSGELTREGTKRTMLTLEFTTESGYTASFTNLAIEVATIRLLAADAVSGATPIQFSQAAGVPSGWALQSAGFMIY